VKLSADSLLSVIDDVLDFSKMEAGRSELDVGDFDLRGILETTLRTLALGADRKGLELLCEVSPDLPRIVKGDANRLRQILVNLVGNAIKFTAAGEVLVTVEACEPPGANSLVHFTVSDTGIGVPGDKQNRIFEPFIQADNTTTRVYGGTGLGLAISKRLVELMGGRIWVESRAGGGSHFHFTVSLPPSEHPVETHALPLPEIPPGVKVLIVDDNRTNRRILLDHLKNWGIQAAAVEGGKSALSELDAAQRAGDPYSLILTDVHMPAMDGFALIQEIGRRHELKAATIMMLSSGGQGGDSVRCEELGVAAYILKPIRGDELRWAIARALADTPASGGIPAQVGPAVKDQPRPVGGLRILIAEDNPVNQMVLTRMLEKRGHSVKVAANGRLALVAVEDDSYDLLLMDVQMPEMDGMEATRVLRERESKTGSHLTVVGVTAHAMAGDRERCLQAGMDGYLSKPIRPTELDELLDRLRPTGVR
jgi:two-component system sensor histidine kinase/response regulator